MVSVFDIILNNFFNPLSSNSNYRTNAALFQFIYEQYFLSGNDMSNQSYQDISSDYLRRFASKEVRWLEEEFDETTFGKYIVITEQGVMLAELLIRLERPEREELSSYTELILPRWLQKNLLYRRTPPPIYLTIKLFSAMIIYHKNNIS